MLRSSTRETRELLGERASRERTTDPTQDYASRTNHDRMESGGPVHMEPIASEKKKCGSLFSLKRNTKKPDAREGSLFQEPAEEFRQLPSSASALRILRVIHAGQ